MEREEDIPEVQNDAPIDDAPREELSDIDENEVYLDAEEFDAFEAAPPNTDINFEEMAENYFARAAEIHRNFTEEEDEVLVFNNLSSDEDDVDHMPILESIL
jgi:hypothetical protein